MKKKDIVSEVIKVRMKTVVLERVRELKAQGWWENEAENAFIGYLVGLGVKRYELGVLPTERGDDMKAATAENLPRAVNHD